MSRWVGIRWVSVGWVCGPVGLSRVGVCGPVGAGGTRVLPSPVAGGFTCRLYLQPPGGRGSAGHAPLPLTERSPRVAARDSRWQGFPLTPPPAPRRPRGQRARRQPRGGSARGAELAAGQPRGPGAGRGCWPRAASRDLVYWAGAGQCQRRGGLANRRGRPRSSRSPLAAEGGSGLPEAANGRRGSPGRRGAGPARPARAAAAGGCCSGGRVAGREALGGCPVG